MPGSSQDRLPSQKNISNAPKRRKKKREHPVAEHRITGDEAREIRRIVSGTGKGIARAGATGVGGLTNRQVARGLAAPRKRESNRFLMEAGLRRMLGTYEQTGRVAGRVGESALEGTGKALIGILNPEFAKPRGHRDYWENVTDKAAGKTAGNLLFHGEKGGAGGLTAGAEIASILPVFRGPKALIGAVRGGRAAAKAEKVAEEVLPEVAAVREALSPAKAAAKTRKAEIKAARAKKIEKADEAGVGLSGEEQLHAEMAALKGEIPTTPFEMLREGVLPEESYQALLNTIKHNKHLRPYEKIAARNALKRAYREGKPLRVFEIKHLETVFGPDARAALGPSRLAAFTDVVGIPRSLQASADVSFPMRQGLVLGMRHPAVSAKGLPHMVKSLGSEKYYDEKVIGKIHADPDFEEAMDSGLDITELAPLSKLDEGLREEQFPSSLVERPVNVKGKNVNIPGRVVRASGRAFTAQADYVRFNAYKRQKELAIKAGEDWENDAHLRESMAKFINTATGRGDLGRLQKYAPAANALFFSPKLFKSRVDLLNPAWYMKLHPRARREAARSMVNLGIAFTGVALGAVALGAQVGRDPRSSTFAKIRVGDTRFDALGGLGQYITFVSRVAPALIHKGGTVNAQGEFVPFGTDIGQQTAWDTILRFARSKASPPVGLVADLADQQTFVGDPIKLAGLDTHNELYRMTVPLVIQDTIEQYGNAKNVPMALLGYAIASTGVGMQTYSDTARQDKKEAQKFKTWQAESESAWKKIHPGQVLPGIVVKAQKAHDEIERQTKTLPGYGEKRDSEQEIKYEHARLGLLLGYMRDNSPGYDPALEQLLALPPIVIHNAIPQLEDRIYNNVLEQFNGQVNALKKRETYGK